MHEAYLKWNIKKIKVTIQYISHEMSFSVIYIACGSDKKMPEFSDSLYFCGIWFLSLGKSCQYFAVGDEKNHKFGFCWHLMKVYLCLATPTYHSIPCWYCGKLGHWNELQWVFFNWMKNRIYHICIISKLYEIEFHTCNIDVIHMHNKQQKTKDLISWHPCT